MQEGVARQMGVNVTGLFLLAYLCDVLSVQLLNQVYRPRVPNRPVLRHFSRLFLRLVPGRFCMRFFVNLSAIWVPLGRLLATFVRFMGFCWIALTLTRKPTF